MERIFCNPLIHTIAVVLIAAFSSPWAAASGGLQTVALTGTSAPGIGTSVQLSDFGTPVLNRNGQTAFLGELAGGEVDDTNDSAIFAERDNSGLELIAREGDTAPGSGANETLRDFDDPFLSSSGQTAFFSRISKGGRFGYGIFSGASDTGLTLLARNGDVAPGVTLAGFGDLVFAGSGQHSFAAWKDNNAFFVKEANAGFASVVHKYDAVPGTDPSVRYGGQFYGGPALNSSGQAVFWSRLAGQGTAKYDSGIFLAESHIGPTLVARVGDAAAGTGVGTFLDALHSPDLNGRGQVTFHARLAGTGVDSTNHYALYRNGDNSELSLIVRTGDAAPGTGTGVVFSFFRSPLLNGEGQTAFLGSLAGTDVDQTNDSGIFKEDGDGGLVLVAREGEDVPGTPPGHKFAGRFAFGHPVFNRNGQTAFIGYINGNLNSGIFAEDLNGTLQLIARTGQLLDVSDNPLLPDYRTIDSLQFVTGSGNEDGRRSGFNDLGQLAFYASFTDGSSGVFVSNRVAVPEPAKGATLLGVLLIPVFWRFTVR